MTTAARACVAAVRVSVMTIVCAAVGLACGAAMAGAQGPLPLSQRSASFDLRADLLAAREATVHAGAAVLWPVGRAVRLGLQGGAGVTDVERPVGEDDRVGSGRVELVARFELDPFEERRWGLYGSAGGGVLAVRGRTGRGIVHAVVGVERRTGSAFVPALELGLGGGVRVGIALRRR